MNPYNFTNILHVGAASLHDTSNINKPVGAASLHDTSVALIAAYNHAREFSLNTGNCNAIINALYAFSRLPLIEIIYGNDIPALHTTFNVELNPSERINKRIHLSYSESSMPLTDASIWTLMKRFVSQLKAFVDAHYPPELSGLPFASNAEKNVLQTMRHPEYAMLPIGMPPYKHIEFLTKIKDFFNNACIYSQPDMSEAYRTANNLRYVSTGKGGKGGKGRKSGKGGKGGKGGGKGGKGKGNGKGKFTE
jgi:uncharacterized membrane protein YgcG